MLDVFSHAIACLFDVCFLCRAELFSVMYSHLFIFVFVVRAFGVISAASPL